MKLSERMLMLENAESSRRLLPIVPTIVRLDGQRFSSFTKNFEKPFSSTFHSIMSKVTLHVMKETNASFAYTQSDEISFVYYSDNYRTKTFYEGKIFKIVSSLASMVTLKFYQELLIAFPTSVKEGYSPTFDCRTFSVPNMNEAAMYFVFRQNDCIRNSIQQLARHHYSHNECQGKKSDKLLEMLKAKNVSWDELHDNFKYGSFFSKKVVKNKFSKEELDSLPEKHHAKQNPDIEFERNVFSKIILSAELSKARNRNEVVFQGAEPNVY